MTLAEFQARLREHAGPVVVDCWAPWCGPCRSMAPVLAEVEVAYIGRVDVWKIDVDTEPEVAAALGVRVIPTLIAFHGEREVTRMAGAASHRRLRSLFEQAVTGVAVERGMETRDRAMRAVAGAALALIAWRTGEAVLFAAAGLALLAASYDLLFAPLRSRR